MSITYCLGKPSQRKTAIIVTLSLSGGRGGVGGAVKNPIIKLIMIIGTYNSGGGGDG